MDRRSLEHGPSWESRGGPVGCEEEEGRLRGKEWVSGIV